MELKCQQLIITYLCYSTSYLLSHCHSRQALGSSYLPPRETAGQSEQLQPDSLYSNRGLYTEELPSSARPRPVGGSTGESGKSAHLYKHKRPFCQLILISMLPICNIVYSVILKCIQKCISRYCYSTTLFSLIIWLAFDMLIFPSNRTSKKKSLWHRKTSSLNY